MVPAENHLHDVIVACERYGGSEIRLRCRRPTGGGPAQAIRIAARRRANRNLTNKSGKSVSTNPQTVIRMLKAARPEARLAGYLGHLPKPMEKEQPMAQSPIILAPPTGTVTIPCASLCDDPCEAPRSQGGH
jgi:hypothetical protein